MSTITNKAFWNKHGLNDVQKDRLIDLYEEVLITIGQRQGPDVVRDAMSFVEKAFADPLTQLAAPEMPAVSWEPKAFNELEQSESTQAWMNLHKSALS